MIDSQCMNVVYTKKRTPNMCVCVCLGLQMGHFGTAVPLMVRSYYPLVKATLLLSVPLFGVPILLLTYMVCHRQLVSNPPLISFHLEVLARGWRHSG